MEIEDIPLCPWDNKELQAMQAELWEGTLAQELTGHFGDGILACSSYLGQNFVEVRPEVAVEILLYLKEKVGFDSIVDVTAVDYPKRAARFDLIYILFSHSRNERLRIKTMIPDGFEPASATLAFGGANWMEREVFDLFGIRFEGHPDLRRILLPDEWTGHPLRKDTSILAMDQQWVQEHLGIESGQ
jgi:NADH-quinone oxidoreductase subunit C